MSSEENQASSVNREEMKVVCSVIKSVWLRTLTYAEKAEYDSREVRN